MRALAAFSLVLVSSVGPTLAQVSPPPLPPPPVPPENPITEAKRVLGKILFWEEQLSSDGTVSCGTCHDPARTGTDARFGIHPGLDGAFGTPDDVIGSPGVVHRDGAGDPVDDPLFGFGVQVTSRSANATVNSAYAPELFWDGRAASTFIDPENGTISIAAGGALESQCVAPVVSSVEMGHEGRTWSEVVTKLADAEPLRYAGDVPTDVVSVLSSHPSYDELFDAAFGDPAITAERIAFAIATYERTLVANQTPWDRGTLTPQQQQGWNFFQGSPCAACHAPPFFTNQTFRNIGLRPVVEDAGRQDVTGIAADAGRFKVPTLRNVGLKRTFMHTGQFANLGAAVRFYQPGNQVLDNLDPLLPVVIPADVLPALIDFLANGLTDPRVASATFPFDRPTIFGGAEPGALLFFQPDTVTIAWPAPLYAQAYQVYRGTLDELANGDYGACVSQLDPEPTDTIFVDAERPAPGTGFFYLKAVIDDTGVGNVGSSSDGMLRVPAVACE